MAKPRILVVDDELALRKLLAYYLKNAFRDYEVIVCASGELAWQEIEKWGKETRIMITDYQMPGMNGIALLKKAKKRYSEIKFLVMSGDDGIDGLALASGADAFLKKSFSFNKLEETVRELLQ